jgi:hypothetical protein
MRSLFRFVGKMAIWRIKIKKFLKTEGKKQKLQKLMGKLN